MIGPSRNQHFLRRAAEVMPGGVSSPVRAFRSVGGAPRVIVRAHGCMLEDADERRFIDNVGAWGPAIVGHAHPAVVAAIERAARDGISFGTSSRGDVELAEMIVERVPSVERVRFANSGTEAVMTALRIARAATRRDLILKFDGCYHGHADAVLARAGSAVATLGLPDSPGVPRDAASTTLVVPFNDLASVEAAFGVHRDSIAAVIVEPIAGNMGLVPPVPGFLAGLRERTRHHGALLVFDEVMTGFRVARGGAQELFDIAPDLTTFGKIIGGGLPVGAVGGPSRLMDLLAPAGPVYQAGTFSGNPVVMAAGKTTLELLGDAEYQRLESTSARLERGIRAALDEHAIVASMQRVGSMLSIFFGVDCVRNMDDARSCDAAAFAVFFHAMLERGVHLPPSAFESWFVSLAHDEAAIDATVDAMHGAIAEMVRHAGRFPAPRSPLPTSSP